MIPSLRRCLREDEHTPARCTAIRAAVSAPPAPGPPGSPPGAGTPGPAESSGRPPARPLPQEPGRLCRSPPWSQSQDSNLLPKVTLTLKWIHSKKPASHSWVPHTEEGALLGGTGSTQKGGRGQGEKPPGRVHFCAATPRTPSCLAAHRGQRQVGLPRPPHGTEALGCPPQTRRCNRATQGSCCDPGSQSRTAESTTRSSAPRAPDRDHPAPTPYFPQARTRSTFAPDSCFPGKQDSWSTDGAQE